MTARRLLLVALGVLIGCGAALQPRATGAVTAAELPLTAGLTSSLATSGGAWALLPMQGFWELFLLPNGGNAWSLRTPPGVADNGGLVLSGGAPGTLVAGFRPSQNLRYSPLATTGDGGETWTPGIFTGALGRGPDTLAASSGGRLLAVSGAAGDTVWAGATPGGSWARLTGLAALARSPAVRACDPSAVTAAAFTAAGTPLVGTECRRHGASGIVALAGEQARLTGPPLPVALKSAVVSVLRLSTTPDGVTALLSAQTGSRSGLLAAWEQADGSWTLSPELSIGVASVLSTSIGPGSSLGVLLTATSPRPVPETIQGPGSAWVRLPPAPDRARVVATGVGGETDALGTSGTNLDVWRLPPGTNSWAKSQTLKVPIQTGSSS